MSDNDWIDVNSVPPKRGIPYLVRYLYSSRYGSPEVQWISRGYVEYYSGEWIVDSQIPLTSFRVTHYQPLSKFGGEH